MSHLFFEPQVPRGKYRILSAAYPNLVLEMQTGGDFTVHTSELNEQNEAQIWKIVAHTETTDDTKYKIKNRLNCGILGVTSGKGALSRIATLEASNIPGSTRIQETDDIILGCSLHNHFWTIDSRGHSFVIRDTDSDDALVVCGDKSLGIQRCNGQLAHRWLLLPVELFNPTQGYLLRIKDKSDLAVDFHTQKRYFYGFPCHGNNNQRWNINDVGQGNYQLKCQFEGLYLGWTGDPRDGGETVASKTPYSWAIRRVSSDEYQLRPAINNPRSLGLGALNRDQILKLSAALALWTITLSK